MPIKRYKPTSPGRRGASVVSFVGLTKKAPEKSLIVRKKNHAGRNNTGKITVRHQGCGVKQYYRLIDFKRNKFEIEAKITALEYDPNRHAFIALAVYADGEKRYILAPEGLSLGAKIMSSRTQVLPIKPGNSLPLELIPAGVMVHNIELRPGQGGEIVRSAGSGAVLQVTEGKYSQVKLPSGEVRLIARSALATIGQVSNSDYRNVRLGKAGRKRYLGIRPSVRGKAMNPVDHPHGGGEGNTSIGLKGPKNVYGKKAYGVRTRRPGKPSDKLIVQKRKKR